MKKSYFPEEGVWLKGNIHSHSTVSDGLFTPKELAEMYKSRGYSFLSITDHNSYMAHSELPEEEIILLTGIEHDIEYSSDKCTHIVGLAATEKIEPNYICKRYSYDEMNDQGLVDMMRSDGQFVTLAHPVWSRMEPNEILDLEHFHAIEVFNNGSEHLCHCGNAEIWWDMFLRHGRSVYAVAVDDVHVEHDLFGGWIWVKASERSREAILKAIFEGNFYASNGPQIHEFGLNGDEVYVSCTDCESIHIVTYPPRGKSFFAKQDDTLSEMTYSLTGREAYVRVVCVDHNGHSAWSNPIYFDERANHCS